MRDILAEKLLAKVMKWSPQDVARERAEIQALATFKYDEYQQFSPGRRFVESLALWLNQFRTDEERKCAYEFIRSQIIFISSKEMNHLVASAYPDVIRPFLIGQVAPQLGLSEWLVSQILRSREFKVLLRQCLFLGLSDGAHTDMFRRANLQIDHEQILQDYRIHDSDEDLLVTLGRDLEALLDRKMSEEESRFRIVFLMDDFSGSGVSYLRKKPDGVSYSGKISKVFRSMTTVGEPLNKIVDSDNVQVCLVLYIATDQAGSNSPLHVVVNQMNET